MEINLNRGMPGPGAMPPPWMTLAPGALFIVIGVLILLNERLLVYMVAGMFILIGLLLLSAGYRLYRRMG